MSTELHETAERRWSEIAAERPDLEPALVLQRALLTRVIETQRRLEAGALPRLSLPPRYVAAKLARGVPILKGEPIPLPLPLLAPMIVGLLDDLAGGGAGEAATRIRDAVESHRLDAGSLLSASLSRDQQGVRTTSAHLGLASDLVWLVGELAVGPFVHALQRALTSGRETLQPSLEAWTKGYCAICGSWPALAELCHGSRTLRCSFCAYSWAPPDYQCAYCGDQEQFRPAAVDPERADRLLELCSACGGYLKALVLHAPTVYPLVAIEDLATIDLDQAAMERGYVRPPLP